jgi:hypothetical protein
LVGFVALFFYIWGAANVGGFIHFPFLRDLGPAWTADGNLAKHWEDRMLLDIPILVVPGVLWWLVAVALAANPPEFVPRWPVIAVIGLEVVSGLFLFTNVRRWVRKVPRLAEAPLVVFVFWSAISR